MEPPKYVSTVEQQNDLKNQLKTVGDDQQAPADKSSIIQDDPDKKESIS